MVWPGATDVGSATLTRLVSAAGSGSINMDDLFQGREGLSYVLHECGAARGVV